MRVGPLALPIFIGVTTTFGRCGLGWMDRVEGVWQRLAGVEAAAGGEVARKTASLPSILTAYGVGPGGAGGLEADGGEPAAVRGDAGGAAGRSMW